LEQTSIGPLVRGSVRASGLLEAGTRVLALLSGGADSVCLVHALRELTGPDGLVALHVNHGLRAAAADDERFCRALCDRLGVPLEVERVQVSAQGNREAAARDARYGVAEEVRARRALDVIATGHTASDQVETVLYRLVSSPGRRALLGMPDRAGRIVRPLLGLTSDETRAYCEQEGLEWREDETNRDRTLARNRLRHDVLPALREIHPAADANVLSTVDALRDEAEFLESAVDQALERLAAPGQEPALEAAALVDLAPPLRRLVLRRLAEQVTGAPHALRSATVDEVERLAARGGSGAVDLGAGVRAVVEYGVLRIQRTSPHVPPEPARLEVPGSCRFGEWQLACELLAERPGTRELGSSDEPVVDAAKLADRLTVRSWREGDRMRPLGLGGTKSLQDIFTDRKVPRSLRSQLPVVISGDEIAWVAGVALSDRFKVTEETERAARLRASAVPASR
jgi:tRNA(Ile)-lysidine synthase